MELKRVQTKVTKRVDGTLLRLNNVTIHAWSTRDMDVLHHMRYVRSKQ